jgi:hypothetical protein
MANAAVVKTARSAPPDQADEALKVRIRAEFLEMPGLSVTCQQAQRLWGVDRDTCSRLIASLVDEGFLVPTATADAGFALTPCVRFRMVKAELAREFPQSQRKSARSGSSGAGHGG